MDERSRDIIALYGVPGVGAKMFARLTARFGTAGRVLSASRDELMSINGVGPSLAESIWTFDAAAYADDQHKRMDRAGARAVIRGGEEYPPLLDSFVSAPPVLFVRGDPAALSMASIAFVGTRKPSNHGIKMTERLVRETVQAGICVVSGMADGIDTAAHRTAVGEGGVTVAVFGCGVDIVYPAGNRRLADEIGKTGCMVSHFPMGTRAQPGNFPARNAVIVGLSRATVVVEAPVRSGALITADLALKAKRGLFAVPGNADLATCEGSNSLLAKGAAPLMSITPALEAMGMGHAGAARGRKTEEQRLPPPGPGRTIVERLAKGPAHIEDLAEDLNISTADALSELTMLEIEGFVEQLPGMRFELK